MKRPTGTTTPAEKTPRSHLRCGLGRCGRCSCPSFDGNGNICEYCGHHYGDHGTSPFRATRPRRAVAAAATSAGR
jgi:hypothetical protein